MSFRPYDSQVLVLNHAPFPRGEENELEGEPSDQGSKTEQVFNGDNISQLFNEGTKNDDGPLDEEAVDVEEIQMF